MKEHIFSDTSRKPWEDVLAMDRWSTGTIFEYRSWVDDPKEETEILYQYGPYKINIKQLYSMTSKEVKEHPTKNYWK